MPPPARHAPRLMPHRVVVLAGGLVGLLLALALGALAWAEHEANDERVRAQTEVMARVFADHATRSIDATALALTTVDELLSRGVEPEAPELLGALKQTLVNLPFLRGVAVVDAQGLVLASADPADRGITLDWPRLGARPAAGRVAVGSFVAARRLGDLNPATAGRVPAGVGFLPVLLTTRLPNGRELTAVALVNLDAFSNFQQVTLDDERMASALLGYDGRLLAATQGVAADPGVALAGLAPFARFLPQREHASWSGPGLRSEGQIASFRVSRNWPLVVLVEFDEAAAHAQWWRDSRGRLAVGAGVLLATFVMTALAARSLRARAVAQARVVAREREMGVTLAGLQEVVFRCDSDGRLSFVNPAFERLTGCTAADCIGRSFFDAVAAEDRIAARRLLAPVPADGRARTASLALQAADGRGLQHDCVVTPLPRGAGFVGSAVDVTERLQARRTLQAQLAFSEMLLESSPLPMSVVGRDRRYRIVNRAWEAFSGRRREDALGGPVGAHLSPEERRVHEQQDERVYATGEPLRYEARVPHADGSLRDVLIEKRALPGAVDGESAGILAVIIDVTEFRAAERATREARDAAEDASRAKGERPAGCGAHREQRGHPAPGARRHAHARARGAARDAAAGRQARRGAGRGAARSAHAGQARPAALRPGGAQRRGQRRPLLARGRAHRPRGRRHRGRRVAPARRRPRARHPGGRARGHLRGLRAEQPHQGRLRRHGPGPGHQPHHHAGARRPHHRARPAGRGLGVRDRAAGAQRRHPARAAGLSGP